jgi:hypothetical protein
MKTFFKKRDHCGDQGERIKMDGNEYLGLFSGRHSPKEILEEKILIEQ